MQGKDPCSKCLPFPNRGKGKGRPGSFPSHINSTQKSCVYLDPIPLCNDHASFSLSDWRTHNPSNTTYPTTRQWFLKRDWPPHSQSRSSSNWASQMLVRKWLTSIRSDHWCNNVATFFNQDCFLRNFLEGPVSSKGLSFSWKPVRFFSRKILELL